MYYETYNKYYFSKIESSNWFASYFVGILFTGEKMQRPCQSQEIIDGN